MSHDFRILNRQPLPEDTRYPSSGNILDRSVRSTVEAITNTQQIRFGKYRDKQVHFIQIPRHRIKVDKFKMKKNTI